MSPGIRRQRSKPDTNDARERRIDGDNPRRDGAEPFGIARLLEVGGCNDPV